MNKTYQPICPFRRDAKCLGAMCALSVLHEDGSVTCALAGGFGQRAVIDRRERGEDPVERT